MKTLSSSLSLGWMVAAAALLPGQAMALAYQNGADVSAISTTDDTAFGHLDGVGYVLTSNPAKGNYVACSGAALSSRLVLTSAHCFDFDYSNSTDNSRTMFYAWEGQGASRGLTQYNGSVFVSPQHQINQVGGYKAYSDIALIVLDSPLAASTPTYAAYAGELSDEAMQQLEDGAMLVGYGQHHEEGQFVSGGSVYNRWVGYAQIDGFDPHRGGTLSSTFVEGAAGLAPGDSGGPLMSWTQSGGSTVGVVFGTAAYARDNQGNGRYTDLGDESYWSFIGEQADFIERVAAKYGETVSFYSGASLSACMKGSICPLSGPGSVSGVPEPSVWALLLVGVGALATVRPRRPRA